MMKRTTSLIVLLICVCLSGYAQKDAKAKVVLDKSSAAFSEAGNVTADFTINIKDVANKVTESFDGKIKLKDKKFAIQTPEYDIYFDGATQWMYNKQFDEVNITAPSEQEVQALNPATIFELYKKGSGYKYLGAKTDTKMRKVDEIELTPANSSGEIKRIIAYINQQDSFPVLFHVFFNNNIENVIHINNYRTKQTISDAAFKFDANDYPFVELIDLR